MSLAGGKPGLSGPARKRNRRLLGLAIVVCLLAVGAGGVLAPSAVTAPQQHRAKHKPKKKHKLPARFFGVSPNRGLPAPAEFTRMKRGGIRSYRIPLGWSAVWSRFGSPLNWFYFDVQVALAAQANIDVLPVIYSTPTWLGAPSTRTLPIHNKAQRTAWAAFLREAVKRYGPHGTFWKVHSTLPYLPIRNWQIWNEENSTWYTEPVSVSGYAKLLKISSTALKRADRGAKVVTGGLYGRPKLPNTYYAAGFLKRLYGIKGVKSSFDALALHPYAADVQDMRSQITQIRTIMRNHGDKRTPLWLDEFGWGSGNGQTSYEKGPQGQKQMLVAAYKVLKANWRRWRIPRTYWFSWDDIPAHEPACFYCHSSGLFTAAGTPKPAWYGFVQVSRGQP